METFYEYLKPSDALHWLETAFRLILAIGAGAILGWERERKRKPAGLRTHMMVALGSATFVLVTIELTVQMESAADVIRIDPSRVLQGVIGGVGFLGAGTIIQARGSVHGITTAASIWVVAALGVACGLGLYQLAFTTAFLAVVTLVLIGFLERKALRGSSDENPT